MSKSNCQFNGKGAQYFVTVFIHLFIMGSITFGIYTPWAWVRLFRLKASHSLINGKKVIFAGTGGQLFMIALVQGLLTIITLGLYGPWALCKFFNWKTRNTFVGGEASQFTGTGGSLFGLYLIHLFILPLVTLGIYGILGMYRLYAWKEEHSKYGGEKTSFGAGFGDFFKVTLISTILNAITLNLFTPWSLCMLYKWQISGLCVGDGEGIDHFPPVKVKPAMMIVFIIIGLLPILILVMILKNQYETKVQPQQGSKTTGMKPGAPDIAKGIKPTVVAPTHPKKPTQAEVPEAKKPVNIDQEIKKLDDLIKAGTNNADVFYNRGVLHASKGDFGQAIIDYTKALEIDNKHADAYYNRALSYVENERYEEAIRDFDTTIWLDPGSTDAFCNRGNIKYRLGKFDSAIEDYTSALKITPKDADLYHNRSIVYLAMGDQLNAKKDAEKAMKLGAEKPNKETKAKKEKGKTAANTIWRDDLTNVELPETTAEGMAHGDEFVVESAKLQKDVLTIRDGKDFFPDHAFIIFLFLKEGESVSGKSYNIASSGGLGSPHIHLQWRPSDKDLPQTEIFTSDYAMRLEFGAIRNGKLEGKIYLCLPDDMKSFVGGTFMADVK